MRPEEELRQRITAALQSRHGTDSVRVTTDNDSDYSWSASSVVGVGHDQTIAAHRENELDALVSLAIALGLDADGGDPFDERDAALAEIGRLRAHIADASAIADRLIHEERCEWSGEPGHEANCDCGVNTLRAMLASPGARVPQRNDEER